MVRTRTVRRTDHKVVQSPGCCPTFVVTTVWVAPLAPTMPMLVGVGVSGHCAQSLLSLKRRHAYRSRVYTKTPNSAPF